MTFRLHARKVVGHDGDVAVALARLVDQVLDRVAHDVAVKGAELLARLPLPDGDLAEEGLKLALQSFDIALDARALGLVELLEVFRLDDLAAFQRRQRQAHGGADEPDALVERFALQRLEGRALTLLELLLDDLPAVAILLALEGGRDRHHELVHQPLHVASERHGAARRQPHRHRLVGVDEVVDVAPVVGHRLACGLGLEPAPHEMLLAHAARAESEDIEAWTLDADAEADRLGGTRLADRIVKVRQLRGAFEGETCGIAAAPERFRLKRPPRRACHRSSLASAALRHLSILLRRHDNSFLARSQSLLNGSTRAPGRKARAERKMRQRAALGSSTMMVLRGTSPRPPALASASAGAIGAGRR